MSPDLHQRALASFVGTFDSRPTTMVQAPGRVNLLGEHTDYNQGFVLPCAIDFHTVVAASARSDRRVRVVSSDFGHATDEFRLDQPIDRKARPEWVNYVRGVVAELLKQGFPLQGMNLAIAGDVPRGAGLSSSASLEVALARTAQALMGWPATPTQLALIAQRAENDFVGCQCGVMDQLISAHGRAHHALLIDCRDLSLQPVALPDGVAVLVVHSNVQRGLVESHYNRRREECQSAATSLGVESLRDISPEQLESQAGALPLTVLRRARHVVSENERTLRAAEAFAAGDLQWLGRLMAASHRSMRDDFEITVPAIDNLVEILQTAIGSDGGARMTGGGFGGCAVAVLPEGNVPAVVQAVQQQYRSPDGRPGTVFVTTAVDGASVARA